MLPVTSPKPPLPLMTCKANQAEWSGMEQRMVGGLPSSGPPNAAPFFCYSKATQKN